MKLIDNLNEGSLDIVGDIHGELPALESLLGHLGYRRGGVMPSGRKLVFVGDLVDRGPDSIAVVERIRNLVEEGIAQCVLGNHELNILLGEEKLDNGWFFSPDSAATLTDDERARILNFFSSLPLALERDDIRVVHACWNHDAIEAVRADQQQAGSISDLHHHYIDDIRTLLKTGDHAQQYEIEEQHYGRYVKYDRSDPHEFWPNPVMLDAHAYEDEVWQMRNPIRVITSGEENKAAKVFPAGGKFRFVDRVPWWNNYVDSVAVVIGHYWRRYHPTRENILSKFGPDLLGGIQPQHWMGAKNNVYCVDFSVGARASARADGKAAQHHKLAALCWPEKEVVFDDGERRGTI